MKVIRFRHNQSIYYGELQGNEIYQLTDAPWFQGKRTEQYFELNQVELISPCKPGKIIATAINYTGATGLSDSTDEPLVFFKPSTSVIGPNEEIISPFNGLKVWGECELAIVINKKLKNATTEEVNESIFGYTVGNDVSADNVGDWDHHLARSKGIDTFCALGPWIDTEFKPDSQRIKGYHNDILLREGLLSERLSQEPELLVWLSSWITLEPGDVILTGAPCRVRDREYLSNGDYFRCEIDGLGSIENKFIQKYD